MKNHADIQILKIFNIEKKKYKKKLSEQGMDIFFDTGAFSSTNSCKFEVFTPIASRTIKY